MAQHQQHAVMRPETMDANRRQAYLYAKKYRGERGGSGYRVNGDTYTMLLGSQYADILLKEFRKGNITNWEFVKWKYKNSHADKFQHHLRGHLVPQ